MSLPNGKKAPFYLHTMCCGKHWEGCVNKRGRVFAACEKCGKFVCWVGWEIKEPKCGVCKNGKK
jgi:hypothetical protein